MERVRVECREPDILNGVVYLTMAVGRGAVRLMYLQSKMYACVLGREFFANALTLCFVARIAGHWVPLCLASSG